MRRKRVELSEQEEEAGHGDKLFDTTQVKAQKDLGFFYEGIGQLFGSGRTLIGDRGYRHLPKSFSKSSPHILLKENLINLLTSFVKGQNKKKCKKKRNKNKYLAN